MKVKGQKSKVKTKFRFLPDIATADLAYEAFGRDYNELFENAGLALESAQVELECVEPNRVKKINLKAQNPEDLLYNFLEELVYLKDAKQVLFNRIKCNINQLSANSYRLSARLSGEKIDPKKHKLGVDVKAVTKHLFKVSKSKGFYVCRIILDV